MPDFKATFQTDKPMTVDFGDTNVIGDEILIPGPQGPQGPPGEPGKDGYTPIKGVDYFTPDEVQEIAEQAAGLVEVPEGGGGGNAQNGWAKLGDITVDQTYEFNFISCEAGVVTIDPSSEHYDFFSGGRTLCVFHPIEITSKTQPYPCQLLLKDAEAGTFDVYNRDDGLLTSAAYDPAVYKISVGNVGKVVMTDIGNFKNYKLRVTTPALTTNGLRAFWGCSMPALGLGSVFGGCRSGVIVEIDISEYPLDAQYCYQRMQMAFGDNYPANNSSEVQSFKIYKGTHKPPASRTVEFTTSNMLFVNGTRFELWGRNDD